ncbi:hypothetical protein Droror1_Dr00008127 [Drosera rotundifolia]
METEGADEEESSVRLGGESRWVDGTEVDSESEQPQVDEDKHDRRSSSGSLRRRLVKKPKRVDSLDVEAMEIAQSHGHHTKAAAQAAAPGQGFPKQCCDDDAAFLDRPVVAEQVMLRQLQDPQGEGEEEEKEAEPLLAVDERLTEGKE